MGRRQRNTERWVTHARAPQSSHIFNTKQNYHRRSGAAVNKRWKTRSRLDGVLRQLRGWRKLIPALADPAVRRRRLPAHDVRPDPQPVRFETCIPSPRLQIGRQRRALLAGGGENLQLVALHERQRPGEVAEHQRNVSAARATSSTVLRHTSQLALPNPGALTWSCTTSFRVRNTACRSDYTLRAKWHP